MNERKIKGILTALLADKRNNAEKPVNVLKENMKLEKEGLWQCSLKRHSRA